MNGVILGMRKEEIDRKFDENCGFLGSGGIFGHSGETLLLRHASAAWLFRGGPPGAGDTAGGGSAGGWRRAVFRRSRSASYTTSSARVRTVSLRIPQHADGQTAMQTRRCCWEKGEVSGIRRSRRRNRPLSFSNAAAGHWRQYPARGDIHTIGPPLEIFSIEILNRHSAATSSLLVDEPFTLRLLCRIHDPSPEVQAAHSFSGPRTEHCCLPCSASTTACPTSRVWPAGPTRWP